ncbi:MAG: DUF938 domain-containing protein [Microcystaceae cyanobacterium]
MNDSLRDRLYAPATERNREPILKILQQNLPTTGNILEIASGTGQHASFFAPYFAPRQWFPSDPDTQSRLSINSWRETCPTDNLTEALNLDVQITNWENPLKSDSISAIVTINMIHISPWSAWEGLIKGASNLLTMGGILYLYGPYKQKDQPLAPSNEAFDQSLKSRNPDWGLRDLETVVKFAASYQFKLQEVIPMPANNLSVIFHHS